MPATIFDSAAVPVSPAFGSGIFADPADKQASKLDHYRRGYSAAVCGCDDTPPAGAVARDRDSFRRGHEAGRRAMLGAFEAGRTAAINDGAPNPPSPYRDDDDLAACWIDGWADGDRVIAARYAAMLEDAIAREMVEHGSYVW